MKKCLSVLIICLIFIGFSSVAFSLLSCCKNKPPEKPIVIENVIKIEYIPMVHQLPTVILYTNNSIHSFVTDRILSLKTGTVYAYKDERYTNKVYYFKNE